MWKAFLDNKLRRVSGDMFQSFFSDVMEKMYGDDFVRVRSFGSRGDKGCDGYKNTSGEVMACYGANDATEDKVDYLISKVTSDFSKAHNNLDSIMKGWVFAHNFATGLPIEAVQSINDLKNKHPGLSFSYYGPDKFQADILSLNETDIEDLLGPALSSVHLNNITPIEIRDLINELSKNTAQQPIASNVSVAPVSIEKLEYNKLPEFWKSLLLAGWASTHLIGKYFEAVRNDPLKGEKCVTLFRDRYTYLKAQSLDAGIIMDGLYEYALGTAPSATERQATALALMAYLFESCDIFEDKPKT